MREEQHNSTFAGASTLSYLAIILLATVLLTAVVFWQTRSAQLATFRSQFASDSAARTALISQDADKSLFAIKSLAWFLSSAENVDRKHFQVFADACLSERPEFQGLSWNPRVSSAQRAAFEEKARAEGAPARITERDPNDNFVSAQARETYYPIYYIQPLRGNEMALGFDVGSDSIRRAALERARDTGEPAITEPIQLLQQQQSGQQGFLVFVPVYREGMPKATVADRKAALQGFAVGVYQIGTLIATALREMAPMGLSLQVFDVSAPGQHRLISQRNDSPKGPKSWKSILFPKPPTFKKTYQFAGRKWEFQMVANQGYMERYCPILYWLVLPLGMLLGLGAVTQLWRVLSSGKRMEQLVAQRTSELYQIQERLRLVLDAIPIRVHWKDLNSVYIGCNRRFAQDAELHGPEDIVGKTDFDLPWPQFAELYRERDRKVISSGQPMMNYEQPRSTSDGRVLCILQSKLPLRDAEGKIIGVLSCYEDITERKQAEEALRQSQQQLRERAEELETIMGCAPVALWVAQDPQCNFISGNRMAVSFDERSNVQNWSANASDQVRWFRDGRELEPEELPMQKAVRENRQIEDIEMELLLPSGRRVNLLGSATPLRDAQGKVRGCVGAFLDNTKRKQAESALRKSQERLSLVVEAAMIGTWDWDFKKAQLVWSGQSRALFGLGPDGEMTYRKFLKAVHPKDRKRVAETVRKALESHEFYHVEMRTVWPDGSLHWVASRGRAFYNETGQPVRMSGAMLDITARKLAEKALQEAHDQLAQANAGLERKVQERTAELVQANERLQELDRLKSQFLATMSHELRTPMNSILGFTGILRQGFAGPLNAEQHKQLDLVFSSAKHLLSLINDLLDLSRIEAGKVDLDNEPFNFAEVVNEVVQTLTPMTRQKNLSLVADLPGPAIEIIGDRKRTYQVLLNLANNAVKFTDKGQVKITARPEEQNLRVTVTDTGIGIKPEQMGLLFEAFRQLDGSAKRVYEGTGLGLHLCRRLLTLMHGEISVQSEFGKGSQFTFTLPRNVSLRSL